RPPQNTEPDRGGFADGVTTPTGVKKVVRRSRSSHRSTTHLGYMVNGCGARGYTMKVGG
ncbi:hypothetical protein L195_g059650, partial [Trifolium pratense]